MSATSISHPRNAAAQHPPLSRPALVPLIAVAVSVIVLIIAAAAQRRPEADASRYRAMAQAAFDRRDFMSAKLCYERVLVDLPNDPAAVYGLARSLDALGSRDQAQFFMSRIAPVDGSTPGYTPAHLWQAEQLLAAVPLTADLVAAARAHLHAVLKSDPTNREARTLELTLRQMPD